MKRLEISPALSLPPESVTQTFGILAVRGAGKSNTAAVMAEEMHGAGLPFVVVDPVGAWWGLRSSSDGKAGGGIPIPIFGGRRGDVPLEKSGGQLIADTVVDDRLSCVIDTSEFSETDKTRFLIDFGERLYRRNEDPLHLFLEEADDYAPQRPMREQARLLRVWQNIVRRGRSRGLGITMVTQRSAALNKDVLTQIETLIVLRTTSPQDRKAIEGWVQYHDASSDLLSSLSQLKDGEAWFWSPHFLGEMKRVRVRRRHTFDSGATPKALKSRKPATLADINLGVLKDRMAETIERAKAEDPRELRRRVAELERELAKKPKAETKTERVEVPVIKPAEAKRLEATASKLLEVGDRLSQLADRFVDEARTIRSGLQAVSSARPAPVSQPTAPRVPAATPPRQASGNGKGSPEVGGGGLRRILVALAQRPEGLSKGQIAVRAGLSSRGGSFGTYLSRARSAEWILGDNSRTTITAAGLQALGAYDPLPTGRGLLDHWLAQLGGSGAARILRALSDAYPRQLTKAELAEVVDMSVAGGSFGTYLSRLRTLELIEGRAVMRASAELFE